MAERGGGGHLLHRFVALNEWSARDQVYPAEVFERRRLYNVTVSRSRHPGLTEYIRETVYSLKDWIQEGKLEKLAIVFFNPQDKPVERLVFQVKVSKEMNSEKTRH